jgi:hypothetical protein
MSENEVPNHPDDSVGGPADEDLGYTETVVEYVDNRQRKGVFAALVAVLVLLVLLLAGSVFAVFYFSRGTGAPASAQAKDGLIWVRSIYGWGNTQNTSLKSPSDAAFAPDGSVWTISNAQAIVGFNPDGSYKKLIAPKRGFDPGMVDTLEGITVGKNGTIYVTDQGAAGKISLFKPSGQYVGSIPASFPIEITTDSSNRLGVTGKEAFGILSVEGTSTSLVGLWGKRGKGVADFDLPHGIAFGQNGTVFVSDTQNKRVKAYDKAGKLLWVTGGTATANGSAQPTATANVFELPTGLTVDGKGRVVVTDAFKFNITALDPKSGKVLGKWGQDGQADGSFAYPTGIDYDKAHDWFVVADTANDRLQIVRLPGSGGTPASAIRRSLVGPVWVCCIPLFLLLAALVALVLRRRAQRAEGEQAADSGAGSDGAAIGSE